MAKVIHLGVGEDPPPNDDNSLIVVRDLTGAFYVPTPEVTYQRSAEAAAAPISDDDRSAAIERATTYADAHGINTVYVVV